MAKGLLFRPSLRTECEAPPSRAPAHPQPPGAAAEGESKDLTAYSRCGSPTPFSVCSPRSSNDTPAEVRASPRTVSDTSTSPGADAAAILAAMLTAPP